MNSHTKFYESHAKLGSPAPKQHGIGLRIICALEEVVSLYTTARMTHCKSVCRREGIHRNRRKHSIQHTNTCLVLYGSDLLCRGRACKTALVQEKLDKDDIEELHK